MRYGIDRLCQIVFSNVVAYQSFTPIQKLKVISDRFKSSGFTSLPAQEVVEAPEPPKSTRVSNPSARTRRLNASATKASDADVEALMRRHCRPAKERTGLKIHRESISASLGGPGGGGA